MRGHNQRVGRWGEEVARRHLQRSGLVLLDQNWRGPSGEIDLVLRDGAELVICEVKTRSTLAHGHPHEAVTAEKLTRLHALAGEWLAAHPEVVGPQVQFRVDLVAVLRLRGSAPRLEHLRGVC